VGAFALGVTPVTCAQYARFARATGAAPPPCFAQPDFNHPEQPVTSVTWFEAAAYAEWLGAVLGGRFRLPSEAEWERAARGGLEGAPTAWGAALPAGEVPAGPLRGPWRVARGAPNAYGLFDMGTIVHEWCADWYAADAYARLPERDPRGPAEGARRASRGGSWRHRVRWSPPSARSSLPPEFRYGDYGFRVLKETP
jgi:formylglycine-generating enzyme required for sulfatase activity